ncbi:MAG: hypothetical protein ACT4QB_22225 [Gammaproteobacteria bacterium]
MPTNVTAEYMGSMVYAEAARERGDDIRLMMFAQDTPEKVNYAAMAEVVQGLYKAIASLAME